MRAPGRRPAPRRSPWWAARRLLGAVLTTGALTLGTAPVAAPAAPIAPASPASPAQDDDGDRSLTVVAQTPFVAPEGIFDLRLDITDPSPGSTLGVTVHRAVTSRSAFQRTLDGEGLGTVVERSEAVPIEALTPRRDGSRQLQIPVTAGSGGEGRTRLVGPGVYPVVVELLDADGAPVDRLLTHLVRLGDPNPARRPLAVAVVVTLGEALASAPDGAVALAPEAVDRLAGAADALAGHPDVAVTVVPTPETVAALAGADPVAVSRLVEGTAAGQVVAGPYVRLDLDAWVGAGLAPPGGPLDVALEAGRAVLATILRAPDDALWVADEPLTGATLRTLDARGIGTVVVPDGAVEAVDADDFPVTLTRPFRLDAVGAGPPLTAVAADAGLADHIGATGDPVLDAHRVLADLAVLAGDEPVLQRGAVLAVPGGEALDPRFLDVLLAGLEAAGIAPVGAAGPAPLVEPVTVGELVDLVDPAAQGGGAVDPDRGPPGSDPDEVLVRSMIAEPVASLGAFPARRADAEADIVSLEATSGPGPATAALRTRLLVAGADGLTAAERTARIESLRGDVRAALLGVSLPDPQVLSLTAREGTVQVTLGNTSGRPLTVRLEFGASRLEFPSEPDGAVDILLDEESTRVDLAVRARGSGDARLDLRLATPDGRIELARSGVTVRTTAVSGVGVALSVAAAGFLVVWWTRTIVRERRAKRTDRRGRPRHLARS